MSSEVGTGKRERKQTSFYEVEPEKEGRKTAIVQGNGKALAESPFFVAELEKLRGDDELVKGLHSLMFGHAGKKTETKKNLRAFSGFAPSDDLEDRVKRLNERKKLWTVSNLKAALSLFGVEKSGDREALCRRLVDFLAKPEPHQATKGSRKRSNSSATGKGKGKGKTGEQPRKKRALSGFMLFSNATRAEVKADSPGLAFADVGRQLGERWRQLSEADKQVWLDRATSAAAEAAVEDAVNNGSDGEEEENELEEEGQGGDEGAEDDPFKSDVDNDDNNDNNNDE
jgi:hypothetical protein